jgi:transcriptional regulator with XRE-family HTH domain
MPTNYTHSGFTHKVEFYPSGLRQKDGSRDDKGMKSNPNGLSNQAKSMQANLKLWRKAKGHTLRALAEHTGNKISTLSSWENGVRAMDLDDLRKLADFYEVHPAALLMTPNEAASKIPVMQQAASIAQGMPDDVAASWLTMGRFATPEPKNE